MDIKVQRGLLYLDWHDKVVDCEAEDCATDEGASDNSRRNREPESCRLDCSKHWLHKIFCFVVLLRQIWKQLEKELLYD